MKSFSGRIGDLRPLAIRSEVNTLTSEERRGFTAYFGPHADNAPIGLAAPDTLEEMSMDETFSSEVEFYGLRIGMPYEAASPTIERLGLRALQLRTGLPADVREFKGSTPEGFGISLSFKGDLARIRLSRPGQAELDTKRQAFWKARSDAQAIQREAANAWRAITDDDDAMLMKWAEYCRPWSDSDPHAFISFAAWLRRTGADERHLAIGDCNWDYGLAPLLWIIRQADTDIASAVKIIFACDPSYYLKFDGDREQVAEQSSGLDAYDLLMETKRRVENGFYTRAQIEYDCAEEMGYIDRYQPSAEQLAAVLPHNLQKRYEGRRLTLAGVKMPRFAIK